MKSSTIFSVLFTSLLSVTFAAPGFLVKDDVSDLPYPLAPLEVTGTIEGHDFKLQGTLDVSQQICIK